MGHLDTILAIEEFVNEKGLSKFLTIYDLLDELAEAYEKDDE